MEIFLYILPIAVFFLCFIFTPEVIFCNVITFVFMLVPTFLELQLPLFPDVSILHACLLAVFIATMFRNAGIMKISKMDYAVLLLCICFGYSQYASDYSSIWTNTFGNAVIDFFIPYMLCRTFFSNPKYFFMFVRNLVIFSVVLVLLELWEAKMTLNPFRQVFSYFQEVKGWSRYTGRFGLIRTRGPFIHPIVAAQVSSMIFLLFYVLTRSRVYKKKVFNYSFIPFNAYFCLLFVLFLAVLLPVSRWPVYSLLIALSVFYLLKVRLVSFSFVLALSSFLILVLSGYSYYLNVTKVESVVEVSSELESSAQAREKVFELATAEGAVKNKWWGNGSNPEEKKKHGTLSILDNEYLLLYLHRGLVPLSIYLFIVGIQSFRLLTRYKRTSSKYPDESIILLGLFTGILFLTIAFWNSTSFEATKFLLWVVLGSAEAFLRKKPGDTQNSDFLKGIDSKIKKNLGPSIHST